MANKDAAFGMKPVKMIEPESNASGRSIEFLNVIAGNSKIADSSLIVPLSEITQNEFCCNLI